MKLARIGYPGEERPAVVADDGTVLDGSRVVGGYDAEFWDAGLDALRDAVAKGTLPRLDDAPRYGPPVVRPGKIVCVGLNYRDHARETNADAPADGAVYAPIAHHTQAEHGAVSDAPIYPARCSHRGRSTAPSPPFSPGMLSERRRRRK